LSQNPGILFAGGCHLNGFPVGAENSLARVALRYLRHPDAENPCVLSYFNLHSTSPLIEALRHQQPDFLVLQVGNYESLPKFEKVLGFRSSSSLSSFSFSSFSFSSSGSHSPNARLFVSNPGMQYRPTLATRLIYARRLLLTTLFSALGQRTRIFNPAALADSLDSVLSSLHQFPLKGILLLSPFPCPDPLTHACRRRAAKIFAAAAQKHGCLLVDTFNLFEALGRGKKFQVNFADPSHLSRLGHDRVGLLLGESLARAIAAAQPQPIGPANPPAQ